MYNTDIPTRAELPTTKQLLRSTLIAIVTAIILLMTVVLPAEYAIDPTGIGRALGLAEMGTIKTQLAKEAEADKQSSLPLTAPAAPGLLLRLIAEFGIKSAAAQTPNRSDEMKVTLKPGEGAEVKLTMDKDAKTSFAWTVAGGTVNFDTHGDASGQSISYEKGRGVPGQKGVLEAAFTGNHGWFWRNRGNAPVVVTLQTTGAYRDIKRVD